jgi:flagellar basal-body rod protein FlgG
MLQAIDISRSAMMRQATWLDATGSNIANVSTAGYKSQQTVLETGEDTVAAQPALATGTPTPGLSGFVALTKLFTQGPIQATGRNTDLAIQGDGFFQVLNPDGTAGYTRNGALTFDANGQLTDGNSHVLQPPITLPAGADPSSVQVDRFGTVTIAGAGGRQTVGQLQLARFTNPSGLLAGANGIYTATAASGPASTGAPGSAGFGAIVPGSLEGSNTDLATQMAALIAAERGYQINSSAFNVADQMLAISSQMGAAG